MTFRLLEELLVRLYDAPAGNGEASIPGAWPGGDQATPTEQTKSDDEIRAERQNAQIFILPLPSFERKYWSIGDVFEVIYKKYRKVRERIAELI